MIRWWDGDSLRIERSDIGKYVCPTHQRHCTYIRETCLWTSIGHESIPNMHELHLPHATHILFIYFVSVPSVHFNIMVQRERERAHCKMRVLDMHQTMDERKDYVWRRGSYIMHDSTIARYLISVSVYYAEGVIKLCVCVVLDMCLDIPCLALYMRKYRFVYTTTTNSNNNS